MTKKPFSFFLELLFVLLFFLIASTILIQIYARMMQITNFDAWREDAMIIAQNEIETNSSKMNFTKKMHGTLYTVKIKPIGNNQYRMRIYVENKKVLDYTYYNEVIV